MNFKLLYCYENRTSYDFFSIPSSSNKVHTASFPCDTCGESKLSLNLSGKIVNIGELRIHKQFSTACNLDALPVAAQQLVTCGV